MTWFRDLEVGECDQGNGCSTAADPAGERAERVRAGVHRSVSVRLRGAGTGSGCRYGGSRTGGLRHGSARRPTVHRPGHRPSRATARTDRRLGRRLPGRCRAGLLLAGHRVRPVGGRARRGYRRHAAGPRHDARPLLRHQHPYAGLRDAVLPAEPGARHRWPRRRTDRRHEPAGVLHAAVPDRSGDVPRARRHHGDRADAAYRRCRDGDGGRRVRAARRAAGAALAPGHGAAVRAGLRGVLRLLRTVRVRPRGVRHRGRRHPALDARDRAGRQHRRHRRGPVRGAAPGGAPQAQPGHRLRRSDLGVRLDRGGLRGPRARQPDHGDRRDDLHVRALRAR